MAIDKRRNGVTVMPTGSGKSLVISGIATATNANIVVLQPTREILVQNASKLREFGFNDIGIFSASLNEKRRAKVTFATIGTIISKLHLFEDTDIVMVDECHLVNAKEGQYQQLIQELNKPTIGLTATPYRMASYESLWEGRVVEAKFLHRTRPRIFDHISYVVQNRDLHDQGYLAPIEYSLNTDYDPYQIALKSSGLNYREDALKAYNEAKQICQLAADAIINNLHRINHALIFVASIDESKKIENILQKAGVSAAHLDGNTPSKERATLLRRFQSGEIKVVINVGVLTVGFDFPALDTIVLARPTMSLPLFYQMVGRGVRTHPTKEACLLIDLCGNVKRFGRPDKYRIDAPDNYKYRLRSGQKYLTNINFVNGKDLQEAQSNRKVYHNGEIPFGRYKGQNIKQVPAPYLEWCVKTFDDGEWKILMQNELNRRNAA